MSRARIINIDGIDRAKDEIRKIGVDPGAITWLKNKAFHICIKLYDVKSYAANIIKLEMVGKGGDAAINKGCVNNSVESTDVILMGTVSQYNKLIYKLNFQPGYIKEIASEIQDVLNYYIGGKPETFKCKNLSLPLGEKTYIMGILNVTPDSFSDGGRHNQVETAVNKALEMIEEGADIIDIGGESTRPGHTPVDSQEELKRIIPVIEKLSKTVSVPLSIDTSKAEVADKALSAGAHIINDVWGLQGDDGMAEVVARHNAGVIMMHNKNDLEYEDLMGDIIRFLEKSADIGKLAGIERVNMMVDPGIGFGKTLDQNLTVMRRLMEIKSLGLPILLGTSRKSMIGNVLELPVDERLEGTAATVSLGIAYGADVVRVHDVKEISRVVKMTDAMVRE